LAGNTHLDARLEEQALDEHLEAVPWREVATATVR
jgi:hypothetical protein